MGSSDTDKDARETWEREVFLRHRWGWHGEDKAAEEHSRLKRLWDAAQPVDASSRETVQKIVALEVCNWNVEESVMALCRGIGSKAPIGLPIGHLESVSGERARKVWAYYLTLRDSLPSQGRSSYAALLGMCDPDEEIRHNVRRLLGERNELKDLYVERFCLCLEFWLGGFLFRDSAQMIGHAAAVSAVEEEIGKRDAEKGILEAMKGDGDGWLQPCSHKAFGRYDDILASIGAGKWAGWTHWTVDDGVRRADNIDAYLSAIEAWISGDENAQKGGSGEPFKKIHAALGEPDATKVFLVSLLISLLRAQTSTARVKLKQRAEKEAKRNAASH